MIYVRVYVLILYVCICFEGVDGLWWEVRRYVEIFVEFVGLWDVSSRVGVRFGSFGCRRWF